jgi:UPF0176 protein
MPVAEEDKISPQYEEGVSCSGCYSTRKPEQRERYAERHRQARLAEERGRRHIGPQLPDG